jgi:hypothetical protein
MKKLLKLSPANGRTFRPNSEHKSAKLWAPLPTRSIVGCIELLKGLSPPVLAKDDVIKKCFQQLGLIQGVDHIDGFNLLSPTLQAIQLHNPEFRYELEVGFLGLFKRLAVVMPHAAQVFPFLYKAVGLDGAHCKRVKVRNRPRMLLKQNTLLMLTGRTPNNSMTILAFSICYSENSDDISHLLRLCIQSGLPLNSTDITIVTDG